MIDDPGLIAFIFVLFGVTGAIFVGCALFAWQIAWAALALKKALQQEDPADDRARADALQDEIARLTARRKSTSSA